MSGGGEEMSSQIHGNNPCVLIRGIADRQDPPVEKRRT
jgi:hypothetical protein